MRPIKFRGLIPDSNKWLSENLVIHGIIAYILSKGEGQRECANEVLLDTVGQFTGLTDRNGKEVYEGDILKLHLPDNSYGDKFEPRVVTMIFEDYGWYLYPFNKLNGTFYFGCILPKHLEVIGNIHSNPELL